MPSVLGTNVLAEVAGAVTDFFEKLSGQDGTMWLNAFKRFLRRENPWPTFLVWRTIRIGAHKNLRAFNKMLSRFKMSSWAKDILDKPVFTLTQTEEWIPLCVATVKELTGKNEATTAEIFDVIKRVGEFCPAEVGPALREQYLDQPNGEWLRIAMEPITDSDGNPGVFDVDCDSDGLWLGADSASPGDVWDGNDRFVFRARK